MKSRIKFLDPILAIGVTFSIAVAIVLVLIGQDEVISLLIGLTLTVVTLVIDIIARIKETEERIIQASNLANVLTKNPSLLSVVSQIVNDYSFITQLGFGFFIEKADNVFLKCRKDLHSMAERHLSIDMGGVEPTYGRRGIREAQQSLKAVAYAEPSFWKSTYGKDYMSANAEAAARGVEFTRVWIQDRETIIEYRDILFMQQEAGIQVRLAFREELPRRLLEDYLIIDEKILVKLELMADGRAKSQHISIDSNEVDRAVSDFDLLLKHSYSLNEYFR